VNKVDTKCDRAEGRRKGLCIAKSDEEEEEEGRRRRCGGGG
jgi:hypothetical protein